MVGDGILICSIDMVTVTFTIITTSQQIKHQKKQGVYVGNILNLLLRLHIHPKYQRKAGITMLQQSVLVVDFQNHQKQTVLQSFVKVYLRYKTYGILLESVTLYSKNDLMTEYQLYMMILKILLLCILEEKEAIQIFG